MKLVTLFIAIANMLLFFPATHAETITYPFDTITITSAYMFEVLCDEEPHVDSYLNGLVAEGESMFVYVGSLVFSSGLHFSNSYIAIVTNAEGEDICKWLINSGTWEEGVKETISYSSHITIDPAVGVVKNLENQIYSAVIERTVSNICSFSASGDSFSQTFEMVVGSYAEETDLSIIISAYGG